LYGEFYLILKYFVDGPIIVVNDRDIVDFCEHKTDRVYLL